MNFRIADTFTASLARLPNDSQKAAKTTAFDLQTNPSHPGLSLHRLSGARDSNFWSARVNRDFRIIVHQTDDGMTLCYVDHHEEAYRWAERRKLAPHPTTGAAQLVELREVVQEIPVVSYVTVEQATPAKPLLFENIPDEQLLGYGVPPEWLADVKVADEDSVLELANHLPSEAGEAVLELAVGKTPQPSLPAPDGADPFDHPDALRRFRVMRNIEELREALEYPWEKWTIFLHPAQVGLVERKYNGPARVSGSAGTGKTVVALHRAAYLAKSNPEARILLTTFSGALANLLKTKLHRLMHTELEPDGRLTVDSLDTVGLDLYKAIFGPPSLAKRETVRKLLLEAITLEGTKFSLTFLTAEWERVIDAWQLASWEDYRDIARIGRYRRLTGPQRQTLWPIFERVRSGLREQKLVTMAEVFERLTCGLNQEKQLIFDHVVVDEAQDISVAQLRFLAALAGEHPNGLFFAGDLGQRIFQQPFSWKELGVDVRGRSQTLRINYRTSHQIRMQADHLLDPELSDVDGNVEDRKGTISVFNGPRPSIQAFGDEEMECEKVSEWLIARVSEYLSPSELSVFVRSKDQLGRAVEAIKRTGMAYAVIDECTEGQDDCLRVGTMHLAKGLEFRAVVVMACDAEVIPLQSRVESIADEADLDEVYNSERHLLYVACTRARDNLLVTGVRPASEFLDDMNG